MNYLITLLTVLSTFLIAYFLDVTLTFTNFLWGSLIYVVFGIFNTHKTWHFLSLLNSVSKAGNTEAIKDLERIVVDGPLINALIDFSFSAIIVLIGLIGGYFYLPLAVAGYAASCAFMLLSHEIRKAIADVLNAEEQEDQIEE